jgi:hypothetical protein
VTWLLPYQLYAVLPRQRPRTFSAVWRFRHLVVIHQYEAVSEGAASRGKMLKAHYGALHARQRITCAGQEFCIEMDR